MPQFKEGDYVKFLGNSVFPGDPKEGIFHIVAILHRSTATDKDAKKKFIQMRKISHIYKVRFQKKWSTNGDWNLRPKDDIHFELVGVHPDDIKSLSIAPVSEYTGDTVSEDDRFDYPWNINNTHPSTPNLKQTPTGNKSTKKKTKKINITSAPSTPNLKQTPVGNKNTKKKTKKINITSAVTTRSRLKAANTLLSIQSNQQKQQGPITRSAAKSVKKQLFTQ